MKSLLTWTLFVTTCGEIHAAQSPEPDVRFMELVEKQEGEDRLPRYRLVDDGDRVATYLAWMENEWAEWALDLYKQTLRIAQVEPRIQPSSFFVALIPGGNQADVGFELVSGSDSTMYPEAAYVKLGPDDWRFRTTLLHETGHVVLAVLNGGNEIPKRRIAAIPHTTAALTDRGTAFDEGYAIHLETLLAHIGTEPFTRDRYRHGQYLFGSWPDMLSEYYRQSSDLRTFSQTVARYYEIRENSFAFVSAFRGPDYIRVQMEKSRDFSELRNANQVLQSEGFYASFFFGLLVRGKSAPSRAAVLERQGRVLNTITTVLSSARGQADIPYLIHFVETYSKLYPAESSDILDVFLDLSHGVFVDPRAQAIWRDHYLAALRLDFRNLNTEPINEARQKWREQAEHDPQVLYSRLGPQIRCQVIGPEVTLVALEAIAPLSFDINTVQEGILRLIPGIAEADVNKWLGEREIEPFSSVADFLKRVEPGEAVLSKLSFEP